MASPAEQLLQAVQSLPPDQNRMFIAQPIRRVQFHRSILFYQGDCLATHFACASKMVYRIRISKHLSLLDMPSCRALVSLCSLEGKYVLAIPTKR